MQKIRRITVSNGVVKNEVYSFQNFRENTVKTKLTYIAEDGSEFDTQKECEQHEAVSQVIALICKEYEPTYKSGRIDAFLKAVTAEPDGMISALQLLKGGDKIRKAHPLKGKKMVRYSDSFETRVLSLVQSLVNGTEISEAQLCRQGHTGRHQVRSLLEKHSQLSRKEHKSPTGRLAYYYSWQQNGETQHENKI